MANASVFKANGLADVELVVGDVVNGVDTHSHGVMSPFCVRKVLQRKG